MNGTCFAAYMSIIGTAPVRMPAHTRGASIPAASPSHDRRHCTRVRAPTRDLVAGARISGARWRDLFIPRPCVYERRHARGTNGRDLFIPRPCVYERRRARETNGRDLFILARVYARARLRSRRTPRWWWRRCECVRGSAKWRLMDSRRGGTVCRDRVAKAARSSVIPRRSRGLPRSTTEPRFLRPTGRRSRQIQCPTEPNLEWSIRPGPRSSLSRLVARNWTSGTGKWADNPENANSGVVLNSRKRVGPFNDGRWFGSAATFTPNL